MRILASVLVLLFLITGGYGSCSSSQQVQDKVVIQSPGYPKGRIRHSCKRYQNTYTSPPGSTLSMDCPDFTIQCRGQNNFLLVTGAKKKCGKSFPKVTTSDNVLKVEYGARYNRAPDSSKWNVFKFKCQIKVHKPVEHFTTCDCPVQQSALNTGHTSGTDAEEGEFPYMVAIMKEDKVVCGGSLITDKWVVTSVVCGVRRSHLLKMGFVSLKNRSPNEVTRNAKSVKIHVHFKAYSQRFNVALVELDEPVTFTPFIRPICLPDELEGETLDNELVTATGWGKSKNSEFPDILQKVTLGVVDVPTCDIYFPGKTVNYERICTIAHSKDTCKHDDGGPLTYTRDGKTYLVGVASVTDDGCAETKTMSLFTRVSSFAVLLWIRDNIEEQCETPSHTPYSCDVCGRRMFNFQQTRMYGGEEAAEGEFPYQAKFVREYIYHMGGGSLISDEWVITTAECDVQKYIDLVLLGNLKGGEEVFIHISKVVTHPKYDSFAQEYSIALVKLYTPVAFTEYIQPICLPDSFTDNSFLGLSAVTTGWGRMDPFGHYLTQLHKVTLNIVEQRVCIRKDLKMFNSSLCAYAVGKNLCVGDHGAPLAYQQHDRFYLIGVMVTSQICYGLLEGVSYANVAHASILPWLQNTTGIICTAP